MPIRLESKMALNRASESRNCSKVRRSLVMSRMNVKPDLLPAISTSTEE